MYDKRDKDFNIWNELPQATYRNKESPDKNGIRTDSCSGGGSCDIKGGHPASHEGHGRHGALHRGRREQMDHKDQEGVKV